MTINDNTTKYFWKLLAVFISYSVIGSYIISKEYLELIYLLIFYICIIISKVMHKYYKNHILDGK